MDKKYKTITFRNTDGNRYQAINTSNTTWDLYIYSALEFNKKTLLAHVNMHEFAGAKQVYDAYKNQI